jgi:hypothetical protein
MICHQRVIRDAAAPEPDEELKRELARDFSNATVRQITREEAKPLILKYEWLGTMGSARWFYGLFFGPYLAGCEAFGSTVGNHVASSIAGKKHASRVCELIRGCCVPWADNPVESKGRIHTGRAASHLINEACKRMAEEHNRNIVVAYSDPRAGEIGICYQATNFMYTGRTSPTEQFKMPDGSVHDCKQLSNLSRDRCDRRGLTLSYKHSRETQRLMLLEQGAEFFMGAAKHRYVLISGDRRTRKMLRTAMILESLPYPKR